MMNPPSTFMLIPLSLIPFMGLLSSSLPWWNSTSMFLTLLLFPTSSYVQRILFLFLFIFMQVNGASSHKTQHYSWIFQNLINWDYPLGTVQGGVTNKGLQEMLVQVLQDMAFPNFNFFFEYMYKVWNISNSLQEFFFTFVFNFFFLFL